MWRGDIVNIEKNKIYLGDCLEIMPFIESKSIDMILCDLPYGTTACKWDILIPFDKLWENYSRIIKDNRAIVLFGSEPFSSHLRLSNIKNYKYDWIWQKSKATNFFNCNRQPLRKHEIISIFNSKVYYPQKEKRDYVYIDKRENKSKQCKQYHNTLSIQQNNNGMFYPTSIIKYNQDDTGLHPTQKPVALLEYLIKTYTNEGELVLDNCMGSGSTIIACINTNRNYIGIEKEEKYFNIANNRIRGTEL